MMYYVTRATPDTIECVTLSEDCKMGSETITMPNKNYKVLGKLIGEYDADIDHPPMMFIDKVVEYDIIEID